MRLPLLVSAIVLGFTVVRGAPAISVSPAPSPAAGPALAPMMTIDSHGQAWACWIEPTAGAPAAGGAAHPGTAANTLFVSAFDAQERRWGGRHVVASGSSVGAHPADPPQLAIDGTGGLYCVWTDDRGGAWLGTSRDQGAHWTAPVAWAAAGDEVEKFSLCRLANGRILAAWLDGRARQGDSGPQQLRAREIGGAPGAEQVVDAQVCDCCQTSLAAFMDGGALLAYRGRTDEEVRDIHVARFRQGNWDEPRVLSNDGWRLKACPVNGPSIASDGSRLAAAWFTGAGSESRVLASYSPDAGTRWLMPLRIDQGQPVGHVATVLLRDGAFVVVWLEADGSLWLRRVSPDYAATEPVRLAAPGQVAGRSFPAVALVRDYAGQHTAAELLVAYTGAASSPHIAVVDVQVPEGDLVTAERNCDCAPTWEQLQGFAIRGTITAVDQQNHSAQARHGAVPGVFEPGMHVFAIDPAEFSTLKPGQPFLGRVEWRNGAWHLFDLRFLAAGDGL